MPDTRTERDALGEIEVPATARYGAQTARALANFPVSGYRLPRRFVAALGTVKRVAAELNRELAELDAELSEAIVRAAEEVISGDHDEHFAVDVFQTGSGTSTNMNANEVIAHRASELLGDADAVHPNDHVNRSQSSNDTIPTALHLACEESVAEDLRPALGAVIDVLRERAAAIDVVTTGRTHLMDATPISWRQRLENWAVQLQDADDAVVRAQERLRLLPQGGTAVGTGINAPRDFAARFAAVVSERRGRTYAAAAHPGAIQSSLAAPLELSAALRNLALVLMKLAGDLRWLNSGPLAGLAEVRLPAVQPGSSIMPGKVNPVLEESLIQVCCQVIGHDAALTAAAGSLVNFELAVAQPLAAYDLLESLRLLANGCRAWLPSLRGFEVDAAHCREALARNPILVTALAPEIGYDAASAIAKRALAEGRSVREVAAEDTDLDDQRLDELLDPARMTGF